MTLDIIYISSIFPDGAGIISTIFWAKDHSPPVATSSQFFMRQPVPLLGN